MRGRPVIVIAALLALGLSASATGYVVERGDSLWAIAQQHGTTVAELVALNEIDDPDLIHVGQTLRLPGDLVDESAADPDADAQADDQDRGTSATEPVADARDEAASDAGVTYRVQRGDTLFAIARRHGTSPAELARLNALPNPNLIRVDQVLTISGDPAAAPQPPAAAPPPRASLSQAEVGALLERTARAHGLDPALVKAVAWQESRWRPDAISSAGARGVMQVMPATARWISSALAGHALDLDDPADNVLAGVLYLRYLDRQVGGDQARLLASYFQGPNAVARHGISPAGQRYVSSVRTLIPRFR